MITASIVAFHTRQNDLKRLIDCVLRSNIDQLWLIDNSTNDELREFVSSEKRIKYIHSLNLGYGSGHNIAIRKSIEMQADFHIVLNPDIYWNGDIIEELANYMIINPDVGQVMPKVLYPNGSIQYLCKLLPTPLDLIGRRFIPFVKLQEKIDYRYEMHWSRYDKIMEVPSLSGCFMFLRTSILKEIGGFDERYFMYAEDLDLCRRIGTISKTVYYPLVSITHEYEKGSYKNNKLLKYHIISIIKYFNKWGWIFDTYRKRTNKKALALKEALTSTAKNLL